MGISKFPNLVAEMRRYGLTEESFSRAIDMSAERLHNRLIGSSDFKLSDMFKIQKAIPGNLSLLYLFNEKPWTFDRRPEINVPTVETVRAMFGGADSGTREAPSRQ